MDKDVMNEVFLCLGGNLGNRLQNFNKAKTLISQACGKIEKESKIYETEAWGSNSKKKFLNQVIKISSPFSAAHLLKKLLTIEKKLGRTRTKNKNGDRIIDIDILFFNNEIIKDPLVEIPHPRLHLRNFVLKPLNDIAPKYVHPVLKKNINTLLKQSTDKLEASPVKTTKYICIEGNIGSGKSTLARLLATELNAVFLAEEFEKNDLLPLFYKDPATYAFPLEYSFLLARYQQILDTFKKNKTGIIVSDYSIYKCLWFARVNLSSKDYLFFKKHFKAIISQLPEPDLVVYLHTSTSNLKKNIRARGREYESGITSAYLAEVDKEYSAGLAGLKHAQTLILNIKRYTPNLHAGLIKTIKKQLD